MVSKKQIQELKKKWESLTISSDIMFGMVMEDKTLCLELIRRAVPELKVESIQMVRHQLTVDGPLDARGGRFDIFAKDKNGRLFVVEMQVANEQNLPYRLRYYQDLMDYTILNEGDPYSKLSRYETYAIVFCDFDYYGYGDMRYDVENRVVQHLDDPTRDHQHMIVFNAKSKELHGNIKIKNFLKLMHGQVVTNDEFVERLIKIMNKIKKDPERRRNFMSYEMNLMDARDEGEEKGLEKGLGQGIKGAAQLLKSYEPNREKIVKALMHKFNLTQTEAKHYLDSTD